MTSITLHLRTHPSSSSSIPPSPLPQLLHTPSGLALLELQGTFNFPDEDDNANDEENEPLPQQKQPMPIGRVIFPDYRPGALGFDPAGTAWMKRVYMYVGDHQRLLGEVKKLPKPLAVVRRRGGGLAGQGEEEEGGLEELEVVDVVKFKLVFAQRPEPVTGG